MDTNDWQRIEEVFHEALELETAVRESYLAEACCGNESLRREVESLIMAFERESSFIEQPIVSLGMKVFCGGPSGALAGRSIGHYKVIRLLGKGGMGEVYLAQDHKLERLVALKFLGNRLLGDEWAKEHLVQEARAIARLENPNICGVYGMEEADGRNFIVMQYVEGETLASIMRQGPLMQERVLDLAKQIVGALSAAHERGIIHRDIKPQNIVVKPDDQVKVLDFGLAKLAQQKQGPVRAGDAPHHTAETGLVVGTVAYMSPEQARGDELDCRSDIFSCGIVLYEMLSGHSPFLRDTEEATIAAIIEEEPPPIDRHGPSISEDLERIVRRCLEKRSEQRYATTAQLLDELYDLEKRRDLRSKLLLQGPAPARRSPLIYYAAAFIFIACLLIGADFLYYRFFAVHTLAVLPIINESGDPGADYIGTGLTQTLTDKLSYFQTLRVKPPALVGLYGKQGIDPIKAGRDLKVDAIFIGELTRQDGALLLRARIMNTADGSQSWERTFKVQESGLVTLQDEIARDVISSMYVTLMYDEAKLLVKHDTDNQEAFRLYMLGRYYWSKKRDRDTIRTAISFFERAIELDPLFAKAYAGMADSYVIMNSVAYGAEPSREAMVKARAAAKEAINLDNTLCEAHTSLGIVKLRYEWNWEDAEREFKQALALDPDYAPAHYWYANLLVVLNHPNQALTESEIAEDLDPFSPLNAMNHGRTLYYARRYDDAAGYFREMLKKSPDDTKALYMLGLVLLQKRMYQEGIETLQKLHSIDPLFADAPLGYAYGKVGRKAEALDILRELEELSRTRHVPPQEKVIIYIGLNDKDEAFRFLEEAYQERFAGLTNFTTEPLFDDLRSDPRFDDLARRIGLPL
jgi:serine/threonine protein kinase/TolB-like protein/Flp pilus assembly protein TadD